MTSSNHAPLKHFVDRLLRRSTLGPQEQQAILNLRSHAVQARAHRDIVSPGDTVDHACLVVEGLVARFDQMSDGRRQIVAFHIRGDMCDLHSVPVPTAGWGLEALTTTTLLYIAHADLWGLVTGYPSIALAFWRDTTADGSILAKWTGNIGRRDAQSRIAHLYCEMALRAEEAGLGSRTHFLFEATQNQIADAMGLTSVHVNRMLQALRRSGAVRTEGRMVHVEDWERLASMADFDPEYLLLGKPETAIAA
jgi:CRP-like cAMP-binding protein